MYTRRWTKIGVASCALIGGNLGYTRTTVVVGQGVQPISARDVTVTVSFANGVIEDRAIVTVDRGGEVVRKGEDETEQAFTEVDRFLMKPGRNLIRLEPGNYEFGAWAPTYPESLPGAPLAKAVNITVPALPSAVPEVSLTLTPMTGVVVIVRAKEGETRRDGLVTILLVTPEISPELSPKVAKLASWRHVQLAAPMRVYEIFHPGRLFAAFRWTKDSEPIVGPVFDLKEGEMHYVILDVD